MAELVDALVSNTSGSNTVPVRPRLRVQNRKPPELRAVFYYPNDGKMFCVYVIRSVSRNYTYIGITDNPTRRIEQHNKGYNRPTIPS